MRLVCWDYNGTVAGRYVSGSLTPQIRPNLKEALTEMKKEGYTNVITTTISQKSVETSLPNMGIDGLVARVFGDRRKARFDAKDYKDVLEEMKLPLDQASQNVVVIGDNDTDHPGDIEKVVFIYNPNGVETDAVIVHKLLNELYQKGNDNFYKGFNQFKTADIDLEKECGFVYHGQLSLPKKHTGVLLSIFNGNPWVTPTVLLIPEKEAKEQFDQLEGK